MQQKMASIRIEIGIILGNSAEQLIGIQTTETETEKRTTELAIRFLIFAIELIY
jgi:hypothetical protein